MDPLSYTGTLTMLLQNSCSKTGQTHKKGPQFVKSIAHYLHLNSCIVVQAVIYSVKNWEATRAA